jgi:hypothetical protein
MIRTSTGIAVPEKEVVIRVLGFSPALLIERRAARSGCCFHSRKLDGRDGTTCDTANALSAWHGRPGFRCAQPGLRDRDISPD